jgi:hypothetical protein
MPSIEVTEAEKTKWKNCKAKGGHSAIICKRSETVPKKAKTADDSTKNYTIKRLKKVCEFWGKEPLKPKPKTKQQWLEATWEVACQFLGTRDYEFVRDKIHWAIYTPQVQNK